MAKNFNNTRCTCEEEMDDGYLNGCIAASGLQRGERYKYVISCSIHHAILDNQQHEQLVSTILRSAVKDLLNIANR